MDPDKVGRGPRRVIYQQGSGGRVAVEILGKPGESWTAFVECAARSCGGGAEMGIICAPMMQLRNAHCKLQTARDVKSSYMPALYRLVAVSGLMYSMYGVPST